MNAQNPYADLTSRIYAITRLPLARGLALFIGGFCLLNLTGNFRLRGFDANIWWIDFRVLPHRVSDVLLLVSSICLLAFAVHQPRSRWLSRLTAGCAGLLATCAVANSFFFYVLLARGELTSAFPLPLSLFVAGGLVLVMTNTLHPSMPGRKGGLAALAFCVVCALVFPLAQMFCFGKTDYRRPADVAIVFGARVYANGRPSDALADRVRTACDLYRDGLVRKLLFSGGPGDGATDEPEAMRQMAIRLGVKPGDILLDHAGVNTQATVKNSREMLATIRKPHVLVVSHFYHLPRIKLAYQRAGWEVYTVPAREPRILRQMPFNLAREVAAMWVYYLRPLV